MTSLHQYDTTTKQLLKFSTNLDNIKHELKKFGIKFNHTSRADLETLMASTAFQHGFVTTDIFQSDKPRIMEPHFHCDREARLMLKGQGTFFIIIPAHTDDDENEVPEMVFELQVGIGDFVSIPDRMIHGFESAQPILVARFFSGKDQYEAHYVNW